jgi:hypothetical protein
MTKGTVLSLCDRTCRAALPWAEAGFRCICVDIEAGESPHPNIETVRADLRWWLPPRETYVFAMAWPPCTHFAVSGARWFADKGISALIEGLELVERCRSILEWIGCPWLLENPVGTLGSYWRQPDYAFNPNEFAGYLDDPSSEAYTKKTCLWTGGAFVCRRVSP